MAASVAATPGPLSQPRHSWADCEYPFRTWRRSGLPILATPTAQPLAADDARLVLEHSPSVERRRTCYKAPSFCDRDCVNRRSGKSWPRVDHHWHRKMRPGTARHGAESTASGYPHSCNRTGKSGRRRLLRIAERHAPHASASPKDAPRIATGGARLNVGHVSDYQNARLGGPLFGVDGSFFRPPWIR